MVRDSGNAPGIRAFNATAASRSPQTRGRRGSVESVSAGPTELLGPGDGAVPCVSRALAAPLPSPEHPQPRSQADPAGDLQR